MTIEQAPQTSSRQLASQMTGVVFCPDGGDGVGRDPLQGGDDVGAGFDGDIKLLPPLGFARPILPEDAESDGAGVGIAV